MRPLEHKAIINWYPGHMTKAKRAMQEDIKLIDLIIEIVDARTPLSSRNPDIDVLGKGKGRLILLNKADLADDKANESWSRYFKDMGYQVLMIDARNKGTLNKINPVIQEACKEKIERDKRRGIMNRPIRAMVVGIPNVGKSTFINSLAGKVCAKTGNKPGVTKGNQWIRLNKQVELLDTPGILWPRFEDQMVGLKLAFIGSINDDILSIEDLSLDLINYIREAYKGTLERVYDVSEEGKAFEVLSGIAKNRSLLMKGGEFDYHRAARLVIEDFRSGKLGRITLEFPEGGKEE